MTEVSSRLPKLAVGSDLPTARAFQPQCSARDDDSVAAEISDVFWKRGIPSSNRIVISTGAQRSGEICGFSCEFSRALFSPWLSATTVSRAGWQLAAEGCLANQKMIEGDVWISTIL